jgi:hypothetical protein
MWPFITAALAGIVTFLALLAGDDHVEIDLHRLQDGRDPIVIIPDPSEDLGDSMQDPFENYPFEVFPYRVA